MRDPDTEHQRVMDAMRSHVVQDLGKHFRRARSPLPMASPDDVLELPNVVRPALFDTEKLSALALAHGASSPLRALACTRQEVEYYRPLDAALLKHADYLGDLWSGVQDVGRGFYDIGRGIVNIPGGLYEGAKSLWEEPTWSGKGLGFLQGVLKGPGIMGEGLSNIGGGLVSAIPGYGRGPTAQFVGREVLPWVVPFVGWGGRAASLGARGAGALAARIGGPAARAATLAADIGASPIPRVAGKLVGARSLQGIGRLGLATNVMGGGIESARSALSEAETSVPQELKNLWGGGTWSDIRKYLSQEGSSNPFERSLSLLNPEELRRQIVTPFIPALEAGAASFMPGSTA